MLINVNGQSYHSWDEVPAELKAKLAAKPPDADNNGIPDVFEGNLSSLGDLVGAAGQPATTFTALSVDGQQVSSLGQLPPDVQEMLRQTLGVFQPGSVAAPPPGTPGTTPVAPVDQPSPVDQPWPLQPGQVMLNGVPTALSDATTVKKPWWKRLFGG